MPQSMMAIFTSGRPVVYVHAWSMCMPLAPSFTSAGTYARVPDSLWGSQDQ